MLPSNAKKNVEKEPALAPGAWHGPIASIPVAPGVPLSPIWCGWTSA